MADLTQPNLISDLGNVSTLERLFEEMDRVAVTPGWIEHPTPIFWKEPRSRFQPTHWHYRAMKAGLSAAGRLVDMQLAERRNFVMRNPFPGNSFATTNTLVCAYQMLLPGEKARSHRHTSHALRIILDAKDSYSVVNGVEMPMESGDVALTPGWCWHGHGHRGDGPAFWVDGLDIPLTQLLEPMFFEEHPDAYEPVVSVVQTSPFRFTRESTRSGLDRAKPDPEGFHGPRIVLEAPEITTMGLSMERLEAGTRTRPQRSTADRVFLVLEGQGESQCADRRFDWEFGDTFAVPCWNRIEHRAETDAVLFELSDEPLKRFAKCYRFEPD